MTYLDDLVRFAAFNWLNDQKELQGDVLRYKNFVLLTNYEAYALRILQIRKKDCPPDH
jgi:hypothetical protein